MRDIESLKQRIEAAEKHNSSSELARSRESEALMDMWHKIRTRFTEQEDEIARYRVRLEEMSEKNSDLGRMVDDLLATVEANLDRSRDESVPRIAGLAEELLASEPSSFALPEEIADQSEADSFSEALMSVSIDNNEEIHTERGPELTPEFARIENVVPDPEIVRSVLDLIAADDADIASSSDTREPAPEESRSAVNESLSDGIRDIISRVESMSSSVQDVDPDPAPAPAPAPAIATKASAPVTPPADDVDTQSDEFLSELLGALKSSDEEPTPPSKQDDVLEQELREIESLRNELSGLRDRLSTGG